MRHDNCFDEIRLVGALLVIWGHAYALTAQTPPFFMGDSVQSIGVKIFFIVSGYLVTRSWMRDPALSRFLVRRSLRIFPALAVCVLVTMILIGPFYTNLPLEQYFAHPQFFGYLSNIALWPSFFLPAVFEANPYANAVNGSLWTLPVEFAAYLMTPVFVTLGRVRRAGPWLLAAAVLGWMVFDWWGQTAPAEANAAFTVIGTNWLFAAERISFYWMGALVALGRWERGLRIDVAIALVAATIVLEMFGSGTKAQHFFTGLVCLPYVTLAVGLGLPSLWGLRSVARTGDYSYGLYLYAFPVQQAMIASFGEGWLFTPGWHVIGVTAVTLVPAILSWFVVERPALSLKPVRRKTDSFSR